MNLSSSRNRLIKGDNHVLVVEEVTSTAILYDMFAQISSLIAGAEPFLKKMEEDMPNITGQQFVVIHYYDDFVSPSNFQGYGIVILTLVPDNSNDIISEIIKQAEDIDLAKVLLIATKDDEDNQKAQVLQNEANRVMQSRIKTLRSL